MFGFGEIVYMCKRDEQNDSIKHVQLFSYSLAGGASQTGRINTVW